WPERARQNAGRNEAVIVAPTGVEIEVGAAVPEAVAAEVGDAAVPDAEAVAATAGAVMAAEGTKRFVSDHDVGQERPRSESRFFLYVPNMFDRLSVGVLSSDRNFHLSQKARKLGVRS